MSASEKEQISTIATRLTKEVLENPSEPSLETCQDLLKALEEVDMTLPLLQATMLGKTVTKIVRSFKRHKRTASGDDFKDWETLISTSEKMIDSWKAIADKETKNKIQAGAPKKVDLTLPGPPKNVSEYKARLIAQKKDLFKDPPVLPLGSIKIESYTCPLPKCDKATGALTFTANKDDSVLVRKLLNDFRPNRSPEQVLRAGSFGGTYFRPIVSAVTNTKYNAQEVLKDTLPNDWIDGLAATNMLTSATYRPQINKYKVKCGGSLGMWESSGWITDADPYGWFQWYCRFYQGRRCSDDSRQISRWLKSAGPKGRFRSQLCNKILAAQTSFDNPSISPVIRQTLLHWGLEITQDILDKHKKRVAGK
jgi:hypothetical protein